MSGPCCGDPRPSGRNKYSICNSCGSECSGCGGCDTPADEDAAEERRQRREFWAEVAHEDHRRRAAERGCI